jgi:RNA polymerase sigma factor for flagellar operon FliA
MQQHNTVEQAWKGSKIGGFRGDRNELILEFMPLVKYLAHRVAVKLPPHIDVGDLTNYGIIGLVDAIEKFDPSRNIKFKTYAELRIRGSIIDGLRDLDWVPRSIRKKRKELEKAYQSLEQKHGRPALDEEVATVLGLDMDKLHHLVDQVKGVALGGFKDLSGNNPDDKFEENLIGYIPDTTVDDPFHVFQKSELKSILAGAIEQLPQKERLVISLYYFEELTMKEIGMVLNITESRVSQLHTKAVFRMRGRLKNTIA